MESLCKIREIYRAIAEFEKEFRKKYGVCLNESMLLCTLGDNKKLTSGNIADLLGLSASNTSKVIKSAENKELLERVLGEEDKREMYFSLTTRGIEKLNEMRANETGILDKFKDIVNNNTI